MDIPRTWRLKKSRYRLEGSKCNKCGKLFFPSRNVCPACKGREMSPHIFSGKGTVFSYTTMYQSPVQFEEFVPYTVALIDLKEGVRITAQLTDIPESEIKIGMPVEMVTRKFYEEGERGVIVYGYKFRPLLSEQVEGAAEQLK